jgi:glycerol-3-phosphate dehydrogenase
MEVPAGAVVSARRAAVSTRAHRAFPLERNLRALRNGPFDLLVIGGGIYGAWTACDAAQRGLRVALVERKDWGSGTSSASSKLIHGGLRYLEHFEFKLVSHALRERRTLMHVAPHLVRPLRFVVPVWEHSRMSRIELSVGLRIYDFLAGSESSVPKRRSFSVEELLDEHPFIAAGNLDAGYAYGDAQEDDARLTLEVVAAAQAAGAVVANRVEALSLDRDDRGVHGAQLRDVLSGESFEVTAACVVAAAGPWIGELDAAAAPNLRRIKGVHLVLPALPERDEPDAFLLTAPQDGRVLFVIPWYGRTLVGTTESEVDSADALEVTPEEVRYLLEAVNFALPGLAWSADDVLGSYAGVRTLQQDEAGSLSAITREFALLNPVPRLIVPLGGKYTTARYDAVQIVDAVFEQLGRAVPESRTHSAALPGSPQQLAGWMDRELWRLRDREVTVETARWLLLRHGTGIDRIHQLLRERPEDAALLVEGLPFIVAELRAAARYEMALSLEDALRRRMPLMLLSPYDPAVLERAIEVLGDELGWDADERAQQARQASAIWATMRP